MNDLITLIAVHLMQLFETTEKSRRVAEANMYTGHRWLILSTDFILTNFKTNYRSIMLALNHLKTNFSFSLTFGSTVYIC